MRFELKTAMIVLALAVAPMAVQAGPLEGVAAGAVTGAVVAGPPGAVVGAVIGGVIGGPDIVTQSRSRHCWTNVNGYRRCSWR